MDSLNKFLDTNGLIKIWPKKQKDKELILAFLASKFKYNHSYHEIEMNDVLKEWHTFNDWLLLRRELFERGYFD